MVTPVDLLDQYGSDAARYWSLSARLGTDTAFDPKVLKVGRRLVTKIFNASKFVLGQSAPDGPVTRALDASFLARLRETVDKATSALEDLDYAAALDTIERFFWSGFTDTYVEMVKARARSETDAEDHAIEVLAHPQRPPRHRSTVPMRFELPSLGPHLLTTVELLPVRLRRPAG